MQKDYAQLTMITAAYVTLSAKLGLLIEHLRNGLASAQDMISPQCTTHSLCPQGTHSLIEGKTQILHFL